MEQSFIYQAFKSQFLHCLRAVLSEQMTSEAAGLAEDQLLKELDEQHSQESV